MLLMIDNYDSFTYNLVQYLGELGAEVRVYRNDAITVDEIAALHPAQIVISPGPCTPNEAGVSVELIRRFSGQIPILGVCLGHQCIGAAFGGEIVRAGRLMHGKTSPIYHDGRTIFRTLSQPFEATRYHSLLIGRATLPDCLELSAWTLEGEIMGVRHHEHLLEGIQFHPESILTIEGKHLLKNFLDLTRGASGSTVDIKAALARAVARESLSESEMEAVMRQFMEGTATPAQIGGLLIALRMKGETVDEITGAARAMRAHAAQVHPRAPVIVDTCGTGGDLRGTFNISTAAAFIAAGAGLTVVKHGSRAMSGSVGGADVLEALGVKIDVAPERVAACIDTVGIGFLFALVFHPAMRHAAGPRRELGMRTLFNLLGPLSNPAGARHQVVGVFAAQWTEPLAHALGRLGSIHALVVHGEDGLDEISLAAPTQVSEWKDGTLHTYRLTPQDFGLSRCREGDLDGGDRDMAASIIRGILAGAVGPRGDIAVLNAAAAIYVGGLAPSIAAGIRLAQDSIRSGRARQKLSQLIEFTNQ